MRFHIQGAPSPMTQIRILSSGMRPASLILKRSAANSLSSWIWCQLIRWLIRSSSRRYILNPFTSCHSPSPRLPFLGEGSGRVGACAPSMPIIRIGLRNLPADDISILLWISSLLGHTSNIPRSCAISLVTSWLWWLLRSMPAHLCIASLAIS